jgi:hypothetical protein
MDKKVSASSLKSKLKWQEGFLNESKGKGKTVPSPCQGPKEPPVISQGGFPQGLGLSPSAFYKLLGSKGIGLPPLKLLQFDFKDLEKETEEADSNEETIWLLKKFEAILLQSGKEFRDKNAG